MKEYLLVDGYNVINSWPILNRLKNHSLSLARNKMIEMLQNYQGVQDLQIIVVFDAHLSNGRMRKYQQEGGIQIIYSKKGETADAVIERMISELPERSKIYVVTDDWTEQRIIIGKGAFRITSRELLFRVNQTEEIITTQIKNVPSHIKYLEDHLDDDLKKKLERLRRKTQKPK